MRYSLFFSLCFVFSSLISFSQENCKVNYKELEGNYTGACKNGWANGKGEAKGEHSYKGEFKDGKPNGKGIYYFSENVFHEGMFQDGKREGKGETHYKKTNAPDSIVKGFWSGDEFRGKKYITYKANGDFNFDHFDLRPISDNGTSITIELSTTTGSPNGFTSLSGGKGVVLNVTDLSALNNSLIRKLGHSTSGLKTSVTYHISSFPVKLMCTLSDGQRFEVELFKSATWVLRISENI